MLYSIRWVCLILSSFILISGCKKDTPESPHSVAIDEVQKEAAEAVATTDSYLTQEKKKFIERASQNYNQLKEDTQSLLSDIKDSGKDTWQGAQSELNAKLNALNQTFAELKESSKETMQKSSDAFKVAADELKETYKKTKAEFEADGDSSQ